MRTKTGDGGRITRTKEDRANRAFSAWNKDIQKQIKKKGSATKTHHGLTYKYKNVSSSDKAGNIKAEKSWTHRVARAKRQKASVRNQKAKR